MHILCAFGCVYQMYNLNVIYFSYETTTNVRYETQTDTYLPAITVCYEKRNQIKNEFLDMFEGNIRRTLVNLSYLSIQEQFNALDKLPRRMHRCLVSAKLAFLKGTWINCQEVSENVRYIDEKTFCFTVFPQLKRESDERYRVSDSAYLAILVLNKVNQSNDHVQVYIHSRDKVFYRNDYKGGMFIDLKDPDMCVVKYSVISLKYKFRPFGGCFVGQTREECISKCIVNQLINRFRLFSRKK